MLKRTWRQFSLRSKGLLVMLVPLAALLLSSLAYYFVEQREERAGYWVRHSAKVRHQIQKIHKHLAASETHITGYLLTSRPRFRDELKRMQQDSGLMLQELATLISDNRNQQVRVTRLQEKVQSKNQLVNQIIQRFEAPVQRSPVADAVLQNHTAYQALEAELEAMDAEERRLTEQRDLEARQARSTQRAVVFGGLIFGVIGGLAASLVFSLGVHNRIRKLEKSARQLALGQPMPEAEMDGHDAIAMLDHEIHDASRLLIERESRLLETNEYLSHLLTAMPGVLARLDAIGFRFQYVSPNVERVLGYTAEEVLSTHNFYESTMHPEDRNQIMVELTQAMVRKAPSVQLERRMRHKQGHYVWLQSHVRPEYDGAGNILSLLSYSTDISERRQIEEALREQEDRFRNSFDFAPIGMALLAPNTKWRQVNHALCEILGYSEAELVTTTSLALTHPDDVLAQIEQIRQLLAGEKSYFVMEKRYLHKDGHYVWAQKSVSLVRDAEGQPLYFIAQIQDISERKRIESELAEARDAALESAKVKANFMANMSHEIRTPLNGVVGMIDLLESTPMTPQGLNYVETLRESADALLDIINDILDFSKIEAGKMAVEHRDFSLDTTVESVVALLAPKAHARGLELASLIYRDVPLLLRGDAGRVRQILLNLVGNAIKFTERGETIVRVTKEYETDTEVELLFTVRDSGIGIDEESLKHLFQPFAQIDSTSTKRYGGTGLGLAISKQLAELLGGQMGVRSKLGRGSTFWFTARFEKQADSDDDRTLGLSDWRVLVVDSNDTHRFMIQQQVSSWNIRCDGAANMDDALELLHQEVRRGDPYHLALLNNQMEDSDCLQLIQTVREHAPLVNTRLVAMVVPEDDTEILEAAGVDNYLTKPIRQSQLYNCIAQVMNDKPVPRRGRLKQEAQPKVELAKKPLHVLVAEDNHINQKVVLNHLRNMGHNAVVVDNGRAAVKAWSEGDFDMILMDCHMPDMDGYSATREIRNLESFGEHIPIIALTANALEGDRERCLAAGMDDYISKPIKLVTLAEVMAELTAETNEIMNMTGGQAKQEGDEEPHISAERLEELRSELPEEAFHDLVEIFLHEIPDLVDGLRTAVESGDSHQVREIAHRFKGSCSTLGASRMAGLCQVIQQAVEQGDTTQLLDMVIRLEDEAGPVETILRGYVGAGEEGLLQSSGSVGDS